MHVRLFNIYRHLFGDRNTRNDRQWRAYHEYRIGMYSVHIYTFIQYSILFMAGENFSSPSRIHIILVCCCCFVFFSDLSCNPVGWFDSFNDSVFICSVCVCVYFFYVTLFWWALNTKHTKTFSPQHYCENDRFHYDQRRMVA